MQYRFAYLAWAATHVALLFLFGINDQEESIKYIQMADALWKGQYHIRTSDLFYAGYVGIHWVIQGCHLPPVSVYGIQLFTSFLSLRCYIHLLEQYQFERRVIQVAAFLLGTCFMLQYWTTFLFTDALFSNLLMIGIYLMHSKRKTARTLLYSLLVIIPFFRPVGFLFVIVALVYWARTPKRTFVKPITFFSLYIVGFLAIVYGSFQNNPSFFYPYHNIEMNVICGKESALDRYINTPYHNTSIVQYFFENPEATLRLFTMRLWKVFDITRPYFSFSHNVFRAVTACLYYLLFLIGLFELWKRSIVAWQGILAGIVLFAIPSLIFCVEWSGRFSIPIFVFVFWALPWGVEWMVKRMSKESHSS